MTMMTWKLQLRGLLRWVHSVIQCLRMIVASAVVLAPVAYLAWWSSCSCFAFVMELMLLFCFRDGAHAPVLLYHPSHTYWSRHRQAWSMFRGLLHCRQILHCMSHQGNPLKKGSQRRNLMWHRLWCTEDCKAQKTKEASINELQSSMWTWAGSRHLVHRAADWVPVNASYRGQIWSVCLI